jgi:hypothetical protein
VCSAKVDAQRLALLFSLWPLSSWIDESGFANFHQGLSPLLFQRRRKAGTSAVGVISL